MSQETTTLEELFDQIENADAEGEQVSMNAILDEVGHRSFGPLLLLAGIITLAPIIGDIPGMPTIMAVFVILSAGQLLFRREHFWLPEWLLRRSISRDKLTKGLNWMRTPAGYIDHWIRPRLEMFVNGAGTYLIAVVCVIIALAMPVMEVVPFSANGAGAALTAFGLSLIARDGLLSLIALIFAFGTLGVVIYNLL